MCSAPKMFYESSNLFQYRNCVTNILESACTAEKAYDDTETEKIFFIRVFHIMYVRFKGIGHFLNCYFSCSYLVLCEPEENNSVG